MPDLGRRMRIAPPKYLGVHVTIQKPLLEDLNKLSLLYNSLITAVWCFTRVSTANNQHSTTGIRCSLDPFFLNRYIVQFLNFKQTFLAVYLAILYRSVNKSN